MVSFATDGGTESGLQRLRRKIVTEHSDEMLPWLQDPVSSVMEDVMAGGGEAAADAQPLPLEPDAPLANDLLFGSALLVPGVLHILHTAAHEITDDMECFKPYLADLRELVYLLLATPFLRERFVATCLQAPEACRMHAESPLLKLVETVKLEIIELLLHCCTHIAFCLCVLSVCVNQETLKKELSI